MLPSPHRLSRAGEIEGVFRRGRRAQGACLFIKALANGGEHTRYAVVVSRKVSKRAVVRNRLRRIIREELRLLLPSSAPGFDVVITLLPGAREETCNIRSEVRTLLGRLSVTRP